MTLHQPWICSLDKSFISKAHCHKPEAHGKADVLHLHTHPLQGLPLRTFLKELAWEFCDSPSLAAERKCCQV